MFDKKGQHYPVPRYKMHLCRFPPKSGDKERFAPDFYWTIWSQYAPKKGNIAVSNK
jgi:hypothetical protein